MHKTTTGIKINTSQPEFILILAAAGSGSRFDSELPKQFWPLSGKALLRHTVERFQRLPGLAHTYIAANPQHASWLDTALEGISNISVLEGGETRKDSIYKALKEISKKQDKKIILIHDAARPFFDPNDVQTLLHVLTLSKAATLTCKISDTLYNTNTETYPDRDAFRTIQTPQGFHFDTIWDAHNAFQEQNHFTDDTSLVIANGGQVEFIDSNPQNFKITRKGDLPMAEQILNARTITKTTTRTISQAITRTGLGFDVHAFDDTPAQHIRLGGIDIPYHRRLKGHSDADVVLHTITDALLGAMALGDIGDHFPPSDNDYKNMDSMIFLRKAQELLSNLGAHIINIDVTIMCEEPKLGSYKAGMQRHIEQEMNLPQNSISIKATTTEKLGFTGRQEGIAAQAIATIQVPAP